MKTQPKRAREGVSRSVAVPNARPNGERDSRTRQNARVNRGDGGSRSPSFERPFTIAQAARILGTSPETVRRLLREGRIAHERISARRTVIRETALRAYIDSVTVEARS